MTRLSRPSWNGIVAVATSCIVVFTIQGIVLDVEGYATMFSTDEFGMSGRRRTKRIITGHGWNDEGGSILRALPPQSSSSAASSVLSSYYNSTANASPGTTSTRLSSTAISINAPSWDPLRNRRDDRRSAGRRRGDDHRHDDEGRKKKKSKKKYKIFCDLDGVLADFCRGVQYISGKRPEELSRRAMWRHVQRSGNFYARLPWMDDGRRLWDAIRVLGPDILTGVPQISSARSSRDKAAWCRRELGVDVNHVDAASPDRSHDVVSGRRKSDGVATNVITCWSHNKFHEAHDGAILIDDSLHLRSKWESSGGIFIHHTSTDETLRLLKQYGVLPKEDEDVEEEG